VNSVSVRFIFCLVALSLVGASCSSPSSAADDVAEPIGQPSDSELLAVAEGLGFDEVPFGSMTTEEAEFAFFDRVQTCMAVRGFEYFPPFSMISTVPEPGVVTLRDGTRINHEVMARDYGFGVVQQIIEFVQEPEEAETSDGLDPESAYLETLSEDAQQQYWFARLDDSSGCEPVVAASFEAPINKVDYDTLLDLAYKDPDVVVFVDAWVVCMGLQGYDYTNPGDPIAFFEKGAYLVLEEENSKLATLTEQGAIAEARAEVVRRLQELQDQEIAVAVASQECSGSGYENQALLDDVMLKIQAGE